MKDLKSGVNEEKKAGMSFSARKGTRKVPLREKASKEQQQKGLTGQSRDAEGQTDIITPWSIFNVGGNQRSNMLKLQADKDMTALERQRSRFSVQTWGRL